MESTQGTRGLHGHVTVCLFSSPCPVGAASHNLNPLTFFFRGRLPSNALKAQKRLGLVNQIFEGLLTAVRSDTMHGAADADFNALNK